MTKLLFIAALAGALMCSRPAHARLGQTLQEIGEELGKPVKADAVTKNGELNCIFQFKKFGVVVTFINGKSQQEVYLKTDGSELSAEEIEDTLKQNAGDSKWQEAKGEPPVRGWKREDGKARALYIPDNKSLMIATEDYLIATGRVKP